MSNTVISHEKMLFKIKDYYDYPYLINNTLFSHYYEVMVYCNKTESIYLLGGNNQIKCESLKVINNIKK